MYAIPHRRMQASVVSLPLIWETPLRTGNLRDPNGPQVTFAFESFIDELAEAAKADPVKFRLDMIAASDEDKSFRRARSLAVVRGGGRQVRLGRAAFAVARQSQGRGANRPRHRVHVSQQHDRREIAEVDVNRETGRVWVKRLVCAHDCGLVINPRGLQRTIECGMLHGLSRALCEEVQFDAEKVTSVDWATHPTLRHSDTPERIDVVLVNGDPNPNASGSAALRRGRDGHKPMIAAVANAIHDATGVRLRRVPFRKERVLAALKGTAKT